MFNSHDIGLRLLPPLNKPFLFLMFLICVQLLTVISKWVTGRQILQMCCVFSIALSDFLRGSSLKVPIAGY